MALREIMKQGDPVLTKKAHPVTNFDEKLWALLDDLHETLDDAGGAGLAAPQIGILRRVALVADGDDTYVELVNPTVIATEGEEEGLEGCLSVPGYWGFVTRPTKARVRAQDRTGRWFEVEGTGMTARCYCHEIDHLDGHLYTELADRLYTQREVDDMAERQQGER